MDTASLRSASLSHRAAGIFGPSSYPPTSYPVYILCTRPPRGKPCHYMHTYLSDLPLPMCVILGYLHVRPFLTSMLFRPPGLCVRHVCTYILTLPTARARLFLPLHPRPSSFRPKLTETPKARNAATSRCQCRNSPYSQRAHTGAHSSVARAITQKSKLLISFPPGSCSRDPSTSD